jgi:hypothetical protein
LSNEDAKVMAVQQLHQQIMEFFAEETRQLVR